MRRQPDERGAILVLSALLMVVLFSIVALAIDLGQGRFARRSNQSTADLAASAAGYYLAGNGNGDTVNLDARRACEAAVNSASTNLDATFTALASDCSSFPTGSGVSLCQPDDEYVALFGTSDGKWRLAIQYPVSEDEITDPRFSGGAGVRDGSDDCRRMRITVDRVDGTTFAKILGVDEVRSSGTAVVRGGPALNTNGVAALLLLEREGCKTLQTSGQGKVIVRTVVNDLGDVQPGVIGSDSAGSTTDFGSDLECANNPQNANGYTIYGTESPQGGPSIVAESTTNAEGESNHDGIIGSYALEVGSLSAACCRPDGLSEEPVATSVTSRTPADDRYNPSKRPAITSLHSLGYAASVAGGDSTGNLDCSPTNGTVIDGGGAPIVMYCPGGFQVANGRRVTIQNAPSVEFVGGVVVSSGGNDNHGVLQVMDATTVILSRPPAAAAAPNARLVVAGIASFDDASTIYVGGTPNSCTTPVTGCSAVSVTGTLRINTGDVVTATCAETPGSKDPIGSPNNWTKFATFGGAVNVAAGASISWCQTMVYVGKDVAQYDSFDYMRKSGGINCSPEKPCPLLSTTPSRNRFLLSGGNAYIRWSAPDQTDDPPDDSNPFESLALWSEGTGLHEIKGTGDMRTTGVFIMPNATFQFDGQAVAENPLDAQFFARTLDFSGQGVMYLKPDPKNAVPTQIPGEFGLIR